MYGVHITVPCILNINYNPILCFKEFAIFYNNKLCSALCNTDCLLLHESNQKQRCAVQHSINYWSMFNYSE
jgi:hypothetical protein